MTTLFRKATPARLLLLLALAAGMRASAEPAAQRIVQQVDAHYNRLHSLRVQFTETYHGMGMTRTESGTLLLAKPGRMKWSYRQPAGKVFVIDGKYGYSYTPGDAQAERYPAKQLDDFRSPLRFLLGHARVAKELGELNVTADGAGYRLTGVPKGMEQRVSKVTLAVDAAGTIHRMEWKESDGSTTEFRLNDEQANPTLAPDAFSFQAPPGVVVVRGLAPM